MKEILTLEKISKITKKIVTIISNGKKEKATILTLKGNLGAGKTTLTKEIAKHLGITTSVISPTFVIMKIYKTKNKIFKNLIHIDAYRFEKEEEIFILGWKDLIQNKDNLIILEWPEKVEKYLPKDRYNIVLEHKEEDTRYIDLY